MRKKNKIIICQGITSIFLLIFLCEFLIYKIVIYECFWPELKEENIDETIEMKKNTKAVKALFMTDIHLERNYWLVQLKNEWQIYKTFQTAVSLLQPEVVFILGDLLNNGIKLSNEDFNYYIRRLLALFQVQENVRVYFVFGNHDIGFHYEITEHLYKRFMKAIRAPPVYKVSIRGNHFVLVNSMAMEGDGCFLCRPAQLELARIAKRLKCAKGIGKCPSLQKNYQYSRPILIQHFPMYRESDRNCFNHDEALAEERSMDFKEGWDCLSKEASEKIYDFLNPRVIIGGHTHHGCHMVHRKDIHEYSLSSLNWKYKTNPSFFMGVFLPNNYAARRCYIPQQSTVFCLYCIGFFIILIFIIFSLKSTQSHFRF